MTPDEIMRQIDNKRAEQRRLTREVWGAAGWAADAAAQEAKLVSMFEEACK